MLNTVDETPIIAMSDVLLDKFLQLQLFRGTFARDLEVLAAIMASNSSAALDLEDPGTAIESLSALQARPGIPILHQRVGKGEVPACLVTAKTRPDPQG